MKGPTSMKRRVCVAAGVMLALTLVTGCGSTTASSSGSPSAGSSTAATTIRIGSLKGPTTMGLVKLMSEADAGRGKQDYRVTMYGAPEELLDRVVKGEFDVSMLPSNLPAVLYNKLKGSDGQVQVAAINTLGVLELVQSGDSIKSIADLKGKTIYSVGKGGSPEYTLDYFLKSSGLDPATDVNIQFKSEATEVAAVLAAKPDAIGLLPQPFATVVKVKNPAIHTAVSFTDEWAKLTSGSQAVSGVVVVNKLWAEKHRAAFNDFLTDYEASTKFTVTNPAESADLIFKAGITPSAEIALKALPACNITYIEGTKLKSLLNGYLKVLFDAEPASVGGTMPGDDLYYQR